MVCFVFASRGELVIRVVQDLVSVVFIDAPRVNITSSPQSIDAVIGFRAGTISTRFNISTDICGRKQKFCPVWRLVSVTENIFEDVCRFSLVERHS